MVKTVAVCILAAVALPLLRAQDVIRAEGREVVVDVTVTAKKDTSNLTARDFSVWEDGKGQKITSVIRAAANSDAGPKRFVIYLDFSMLPLPRQEEAESAAEGFIDSMASPDRYMAVVSFGEREPIVLQNFTNAKDPLKKAARAPMNQSPSPVTAAVPGATPTEAVNRLLESLANLCNSLRWNAGRTSVLLFTGAVTADTAQLEPVVKSCSRANGALNVIAWDASVAVLPGLDASQNQGRASSVVLFPLSRLAPPQSSSPALAQYLANGSGGRVLRFSSKLPEELASLAREQDDAYRLAYVPPESKVGSCHVLKVTTSLRGTQLSARKEYCTEKQTDIVAGKVAGRALELKVATGTVTAAMSLPWFYTDANRASVHLAVDLIPAGMKFEKDKDGLHGQVDLAGSAVRADGGTAARFADTADLDAPDRQQADALTKTLYRYEHTFNIASGDYKFQLSLGIGPVAVVKLEAPLMVPPWNGAAFAISSLMLSTETDPVEAESAGDGLLLKGKGPLTAEGRVFVPATEKPFDRSVPLYFYTQIYDPGAAPGVTLEYRVLDAKTSKIRADSGAAGIPGYIRPGNPLIPFAKRLDLATLPAGAYRLEVLAAEKPGTVPITRTIDFVLN